LTSFNEEYNYGGFLCINTAAQMNCTIDRCIFAHFHSTVTMGGVIFIDDETMLFHITRTRFENYDSGYALDMYLETRYNSSSFLSLTFTSCSLSEPQTLRVLCGHVSLPELLVDCTTDFVWLYKVIPLS
jgi:hypothetical protein